MSNIVMIDKENIEKFRGLYDGDILSNYHDNSVCYGFLDKDDKNRIIPTALIMSDINNRSLVITWMYVDPEYRNTKMMFTLMNQFIENAKRTRIIKSIYCATISEEVVQYLSTQFSFNYNGFDVGKVMTAKLENLIDLSDKYRANNPAKLLGNVDKDVLAKLNRFLKVNNDIAVGVPLPIKASDYLDCSMAIVEDNDIKAMILLSAEGESLAVSYAYAKEGYGHMLLHLVVALQKELEKYPKDKKVIAAVVNEKSENLFSKLFSDFTVESIYESELLV